MERPNIFKYDNYRDYLKDWVFWMKKTKDSFSFRAFSLWTGFRAPNQLLLIIKGKRNISLQTINKYFHALKLKESEKRYFELLVRFNQAADMASKAEYFKQLSSYWLKGGNQFHEEKLKRLTQWYYTAIREMVVLKDFKENGHWISKKLGGLITPYQAKSAIAILLDIGLLERDKNNQLIQTTQYLTTGNESDAMAVFLFHEQMMKLAIDSLRGKPSSERNLTSLTFTIRPQDYDVVVHEINESRKRIIAMLQNRHSQNDDELLYQLNFHLFPIRRG